MIICDPGTTKPVLGYYRNLGSLSVDRMSDRSIGGWGSRPLRMKVAVGCTPQVLSPQAAPDPELTAMLARANRASIGLEVNKTRPVQGPRGWTIVFSERGGGSQPRPVPRWPFFPGGAWLADKVVDGPLSRPEAARPPPPSSLPSTAGRPGGTRAFPRWRERSRCTCAHGTPPLGGTVRVSRPKPVSWQPLSLPGNLCNARHGYPAGSPSQGAQTGARG